MRPRQPGFAALAGNPTLVGAVTVLATVVAVFLAYNANAGLPFTPVYQVDALVQNGSGLIRGNEGRIGGKRVGLMGRVEPRVYKSGPVGARVQKRPLQRLQPLPL